MGLRDKASLTLVFGIMATVALAIAAFFLPSGLQGSLMGAILAAISFSVASMLQGPAFRAHLAGGGVRQSHWRVVGVSLVCLLIALAVLFVVVLFLPEGALE